VPRVRRSTALALLLLAAACSSGSSTSVDVVRVSGPVPSISGETVQGGRFSPGAYRGKALVVNFWNEYCGPCRREQPQLELSWERMRRKLSVQFVGVSYVGHNWPDDLPAARRYLRVFAVSYPSVLDPSLHLAHELGLPGIPTTFVADARGRLRYEILGAVGPFQLDRLVRRVLGR
jgi:thiol-disulfide isomerase/thioredoxin